MSRNDSKQHLSSGHAAGLQSSNTFREKEKSIKTKRDSERGLDDPSLSGENAETVYRDRRGKKLDMLSEFMKQQAVKDGQKFKLEQAQYAWGLGSVQKQEVGDKIKELNEIALEPFARTIDDSKLESYKKEIIRDGDPMAAYFENKRAKSSSANESPVELSSSSAAPSSSSSSSSSAVSAEVKKVKRKPLYKGPLPPPNRFKIMPGYRWDAIDRGNKFEHKLLLKVSEKNTYREDEYKYLSSDM